MKTFRRRAREAAFQFLYQLDLQHDLGTTLSPAQLASKIQGHFDHFEVPEPSREYGGLLAAGCVTQLTDLNQRLEESAENWKLERISPIDRNIIRIAIFELLHSQDTPTSVILDEAIELGKQYGTQESAPFINGVLDALARKIRKPS